MLALLLAVFGGLFTVTSACGLGRLLLFRRTPRLLTHFAIGSATLSVLIFLIRAAGVASWPEFLIAGVAGLSGFVVFRPQWPPLPRPPVLCGIILLIFAAIYTVYALAPETQSDPNVYHLKPAVDAQQAGGFSNELTFYDLLPQGIENLFAMAYAFGGSSAAKLVHFAFLLATVPAIVGLLEQLSLSTACAFAVAAFYFCTPVVGIDGTAAFNDAALVFFTVEALRLAFTGDALLAGVAAGFCYGVKMTGGLTAIAAFAILVSQRRWKSLLPFTAAALAMTLPWILRNSIETGNPFAPVLNAWFPNPNVNVFTEEYLFDWHRRYGLSSIAQFPVELTLRGRTLQGLLGPAFLAAPLAVLSLRTKTGRILLALAILFAVPWFLNTGTRFLMPALPFLSACLLIALPFRAALALVAIHAITSLPPVIDQYAPDSWHLTGFPLRAALRLESEPEYMTRVSWDYNIAQLIETHTASRDRILDLYGVHHALVHRTALTDWQSSKTERLQRALDIARRMNPGVLYEMKCDFALASLSAIKVEQMASLDGMWSIHELEIWNGPERVPNSRRWDLSAEPNEWDVPFAFDGNPISSWSTWQPAEPGMYLQADFPQPVTATTVKLLGLAEERGSMPELSIQRKSAAWTRLTCSRSPRPGVNLRRDATRYVRRAGFQYILVPTGPEGNGPLGSLMTEDPHDWGLEKVDHFEHVYLLKIQ